MFEPKIRISRALYELMEKQAAEKGYSSGDEYATHLLEEATTGALPDAGEEQVRERLRGLGYLE